MAQQAQSPLQVTLLLWGAMLTSHLILGGVGMWLHDQSPAAPLDDMVLPIALTGVGVTMAMFSAVGAPLLFAKSPFVTAMILRFAFAESATSFGLVLLLLGADMQWFYILVGLGIVTHVSAIPTQKLFDDHERRRGS